MDEDLRFNTCFIDGEHLTFRPLERSDLARCKRWMNDYAIRPYVINVWPLNDEDEEAWFRGLREGPRRGVIFAIVLKDGDRHIGTTGLHAIDWINRRAESGSLIGEREQWGRGYGTQAKRLLLEYAFDTLGLERIDSRVVGYNERSARHLLASGYQLEGRKRRAFFRHGQWWDELLFGVLADEWRARHRRADAVEVGANRC